MQLNLHAILPVSLANGPGRRFAIWFQGCSRGCAGCFNPQTHSFEKHLMIEPAALLQQIAARNDIEGISISGGEPFAQPNGLLNFLQLFRQAQNNGQSDNRHSIVVFTGYELDEIKAMPTGTASLALIDVLVTGPYLADYPTPDQAFVASGNQQLHFLSDRYSAADFINLPSAEVIIDHEGNLVCSGVVPIFPVSKKIP